ncbi:sensor histidine kinase [Abyssalbus ytuae]|uniref:histidine kinase n=1 Tax=Abyssalbus ytuae TaxID=2926907 RepID=A0A9E6ZYU6_9FLAO|nr:ATP-binding protein [Abyssalbus ytuae]UOB17707.1 histidine kinase [Abyssalbus ytuae]
MENEKEIISLIIYVSVLIVILVVFVVTFFLAYQRRKTQLLIEKAEEKQKYEAELAQAQTEIQEQTFKNISWELHDNVGQLLSVSKLQLNMLLPKIPESTKKSYAEATETLGQALKELRQLSKILNTDFVSSIGLQESLETEIERFKRINFLKIDYKVQGDKVNINKKDEIIIFRIFQECFSNVVKYSKASNLYILLDYRPEELFISVVDDGVGFNPDMIKKGTGLINMRKRSELIGGNFSIETAKNKGVSIHLTYPYK